LTTVSVLFSEPKIPQFSGSSTLTIRSRVSVLFSEPKIPQSASVRCRCGRSTCFSALQRAENSSIPSRVPVLQHNSAFQCSSASRKFLNYRNAAALSLPERGFSALQRAENSSMTHPIQLAVVVNVVSVLFSEPKIPQSTTPAPPRGRGTRFSALQRAENSSIGCRRADAHTGRVFQCSSASRKFLNSEPEPPFRRPPVAFQCSSASRKFLNVED